MKRFLLKTQSALDRREKGVALVVVVSCLILVCGLVLSFFMSVSTETKASKLADGGNRNRDLADTAVNLVMAQIRDATTQGGRIAWASQPGMIRTFGSASGSASSSPLSNYKLYSAEKMVWSSDGGAFNPTEDVPNDWYSKSALYTDLNLPVANIKGDLMYPIVDPTNLDLPPENRPQGFDVATGMTPVNPTPPAGTTVNKAPMPVRWLYVLSDGTLTSPSGGTPGTPSGEGATAVWAAGDPTAPTKDNPIVGRVAFWTDDDTTKVNINTAFGDQWGSLDVTTAEPGSYWDIPRLYTSFDVNRLALSQPAQWEYQRYPGHPATTYLSAVFPTLTREQLGVIATRGEVGGSRGGTVNFFTAQRVPLDDNRLYASIDELLFDPNRAVQSGLTVEQLQRTRFFLTAHSRAPEITLFNTPRISMWPISRMMNSSSAKYRTPFDELIAFCSQLRQANLSWDYFFVRNSSTSPTSDISISRNRRLLEYLRTLTTQNIPGFGGAFATKYPEDRNQILTQIFDYIRSTNLFDDSLESEPYTYPTKGKQFTPGRNSETGAKVGHGQAAPSYDANTDTMGFGRFDTISEVALHFICTADGSGDPNLNPPTEANTAKLASNNIVDVPASAGPPALPAFYKNKTLAQKLLPDEKRIESLFLMELFSVAQGWTALTRDIFIRVKGLDGLSVQGAGDLASQSLGFPADATMYIKQNSQGTIHGRGWGGMGGFRTHMAGKGLPARGVMPADSNATNLMNTYPFASAPVTIKPGANNKMTVKASKPIEILIYAGTNADPASASPMNYNPPANQLVQTIRINVVPDGSANFPAPNLVTTGVSDQSVNSWMHAKSYTSTKENWWTYSRDGCINDGTSNSKPYTQYTDSFSVTGRLGRITWIGGDPGRNNRSKTPASGLRGEASGSPFRDEDVARSLVPYHGDYRLVAARRVVEEDVFVPHQYYYDDSRPLAHSMTEVLGSDMIYGATMNGKYVDMGTKKYQDARRPDVPFRDPADGPPWGSESGDWDNGIGHVMDGPYINKPDEGSAYDGEPSSIPYFTYTERHETVGPTFFSPNRQVMSPVMFGSLPTQVKKDVPYRTLLFRPDSTKLRDNNGDGHIGAQSPKDHLLLDLFWMPVVEPYAISEPFSTAGKINMNYQIMPFTYIKRATGLHALLRSERVTAVGTDQGEIYKANKDVNYRHQIDTDETLKQFEERFNNGQNVFRSASEICEIYLIPKGQVYDSEEGMKAFWEQHALTGDNMKERPYAALYPRLTTKSNTYTIHYKVQVLQQAARSRGTSTSEWATWKEDSDQIVSEMRGSSTVERYIDPDDPRMLDYATEVVANPTGYQPLDALYRFRVINTKRFAP